MNFPELHLKRTPMMGMEGMVTAIRLGDTDLTNVTDTEIIYKAGERTKVRLTMFVGRIVYDDALPSPRDSEHPDR